MNKYEINIVISVIFWIVHICFVNCYCCIVGFLFCSFVFMKCNRVFTLDHLFPKIALCFHFCWFFVDFFFFFCKAFCTLGPPYICPVSQHRNSFYSKKNKNKDCDSHLTPLSLHIQHLMRLESERDVRVTRFVSVKTWSGVGVLLGGRDDDRRGGGEVEGLGAKNLIAGTTCIPRRSLLHF